MPGKKIERVASKNPSLADVSLRAALPPQLEEMPGQRVVWPLAVSFPRFAGSKKKKRVHSVISEMTTALASGVLLAVRVWGRKLVGFGQRGPWGAPWWGGGCP